MRLTGSAEQAEELMQEALVRALRSWKTFRGESRLSTWLMKIVLNTFRDQLAQKHATTALPEYLEDNRAMSPSSRASAMEVGQAVAQAVSSLPLRQREVFVLKVYEGFSSLQVAELLEMSQQNVRTTLHYARQTLRRLLALHLKDNNV